MKTIDVPVYQTYRKYPLLPEYKTEPGQPGTVYRNVPILTVSQDELDLILILDYSEVIKKHKYASLVIITDSERVLAVIPEGYDYARYVCVIDETTARKILTMV